MLAQDRVVARERRAAQTMERVLQEVREKTPDLSREAKKKYAAELRLVADLLHQEAEAPSASARQHRIDAVDEADRVLAAGQHTEGMMLPRRNFIGDVEALHPGRIVRIF